MTRNGSASCIPPMRGCRYWNRGEGIELPGPGSLARSHLRPWYRGSTMLPRVLWLPLFDGFVPCCDVIGT